MVRHGWRGAFWSDAWRVPAPAGAKRHMPGLHTARPHLQLQCYGIAIAQFGGIFATSWNWRQLVCSNAPLLCPKLNRRSPLSTLMLSLPIKATILTRCETCSQRNR